MKRKKKTKSASENDDFGATQMNEFGERYDDDSVEIEIEDRRVLTRMERFVDTHPGWSSLCHDYLRRLLSALVGEEMVLYKEKLNLKPPGGAGFAPHLDTPSLRVASPTGPRNFWTVMVAIDNMTVDNGCLRVVHGHWDEGNCVPYNQPQDNITDSRRILNPDGDGRAGAVPVEDLEQLQLKFEEIVCKGGTVVAFNGWVPHRSSPNTSPFPRRAVFLTYNPKSEGDYHQLYYEQMDRLREAWRTKIGLQNKQKQDDDSELESQWLSTI
jgi:ectoine hydroxylase-related dioxygenase (phytanoyl-CoA dioxygenase family)